MKQITLHDFMVQELSGHSELTTLYVYRPEKDQAIIALVDLAEQFKKQMTHIQNQGLSTVIGDTKVCALWDGKDIEDRYSTRVAVLVDGPTH